MDRCLGCFRHAQLLGQEGVLSMLDKDGDGNQGPSVDRAARRQFGCLNRCFVDKLEGLGSIYANHATRSLLVLY